MSTPLIFILFAAWSCLIAVACLLAGIKMGRDDMEEAMDNAKKYAFKQGELAAWQSALTQLKEPA